MSKRQIIVEDYSQNEIAKGVVDEDVQLFEGAWYFDETAVNFANLILTERIYICPYKGKCHWIDLQTENGRIENIGFTYYQVNPGYEFIQNKIAFYAGNREATTQYDKRIETVNSN